MALRGAQWLHKAGKRKTRVEFAPVKSGSFSLDTDARSETSLIQINLPIPPSANALFANSHDGGRHCTVQYEAWKTAAGWELLAQKPGRMTGAYEITIEVARPTTRRRMDVANREKAISDLLVKHRVVTDDSLAEAVTMKWGEGFSGVRVTVRKCEGATA